LIGMRVLDYLRIFIKPALGAILACIVAEGAFHLAQGVPPIAMIAIATVMAGLTYVAAAHLVMRSVTDDILTLIVRRG
jgi:hypothetical protein